MEEKERYEVITPSLNGYAYIHDFKTDNVLNTYDSCSLLNQQEMRIKELEQQLHDLPKQIVKEIKEKQPIFTENSYGFTTKQGWDMCVETLDTILKKYGGGNE